MTSKIIKATEIKEDKTGFYAMVFDPRKEKYRVARFWYIPDRRNMNYGPPSARWVFTSTNFIDKDPDRVWQKWGENRTTNPKIPCKKVVVIF